MRGEKGKLICVWSPVLHGEGCSTLACSIGFGLHNQSDKRVLIVDKSNSISSIKKYVEKDFEIKYSMDNLKIFNAGIRTEHIVTYATQINTGLYMIGGSNLDKGIIGVNKEFERLFLDSCLEGFELVIADMGMGTTEENRLYLDQADRIVSVVTPNEIAVDQLFEDSALHTALDYFVDEKTIKVVNKLYNRWEPDSVVGRYKSRYSIKKTFGLYYDGDLLNACCMDRSFYSFFMNHINYRKNEFMQQLYDICSFIANELSIKEKINERMIPGSLINRFRRISLL